MTRTWNFTAAVMAITLLAAAFRLGAPALRPMHADEAVHAAKLADLWEQGTYVYDPNDYHGPTLYYATAPVLWLGGSHRMADFTEGQLRVVPALFGIALIPLLMLLRDALGRAAIVAAALLLAVSPAMVFYSRYYIQEMLLVFFTLAAVACGWRFARGGRSAWCVATGVCVGLMAATKETWVLAAAAAAPAVFAACRVAKRDQPANAPPEQKRPLLLAILLAVLAAIITWAALLSAMFTHPRAIVDGVLTYANYANRAESAAMHHHPWYYYLELLSWWHPRAGPYWSEGLVLPLAVVGMVAAATGYGIAPRRRVFAVFAAVFTVALIAAYAAVAYKTPWCLLTFLSGLIVLAGVGFAAILKLIPSRVGRGVFALLACVALYNLGTQAYRSSHRYFADPRNPYVYAHTVSDTARLGAYVDELRGLKPDLLVKVYGGNFWPLPWYLRHARAGFWPEAAPPDEHSADVLIAPIESETERAGYTSETFGLRPDVQLSVFTRDELFQQYMLPRRGVGAVRIAPGGTASSAGSSP